MKRYFLLLSYLFCLLPSLVSSALAEVWTIAIDPGHGGKDPGAISRNLGMYEKNVTLSIARELKAILDQDPNFRGVMTRSGDYYISVPDRSEIARRNRANYLVSIHADSSEDSSMKGASVWVLSNRRANDEMGQWLEDHEKQSELLGGAGKVLANHSNEKYLNQTVLDLQFGHSQREGYQLGNAILRNFGKVTELSRSRPQHASLGVLRSPDIPSVLVETGFLSNTNEEAKLSTISYRRRLAYMIYQGLVDYRRRNGDNIIASVKSNDDKNSSDKQTEQKNTKDQKSEQSTLKDSGIRHKVKSGESLGGLAQKYGVKSDDILSLNQLKRKELLIGETIKIPDSKKANEQKAENTSSNKDNEVKKETDNKNSLKDSGIRHKVKSGESLGGLAQKYGVKSDDILSLNGLKKKELRIGDTLKIPAKAESKTAGKKSESFSESQKKADDKNLKAEKNNSDKADKKEKADQAKDKDQSKDKNKDKRAKQDKSESKADDKSNQPKDNKTADKPKQVPKYHIIEQDQTIYAVARLYGLSADKILKLNPSLKDGKVKVGQKIQLKE